jgi:hypothetical protein
LSYTAGERGKLGDRSILAFAVNAHVQIKTSVTTPIGAFTFGFSSYYQRLAELHFKFSSLDYGRIFYMAHRCLLQAFKIDSNEQTEVVTRKVLFFFLQSVNQELEC